MPDHLRGFDHFDFDDLRQSVDEQKIRDISAEMLNEVGYGDLLGEQTQTSIGKPIGDALGGVLKTFFEERDGAASDVGMMHEGHYATEFFDGGDFIL